MHYHPCQDSADVTLEFDMRLGNGDALVEITASLVDGCADSLTVMYRGIDITDTINDQALEDIDKHIDRHFHDLCWAAKNGAQLIAAEERAQWEALTC